MKIRNRTILLVISVIIGTLVVTVLTSNFVVLAGFSSIENSDTVTQTKRAVSALDSQIASLDLFVVDYATWDDTYQFIQNNNTAFIENNIVDETFQHSKLNFMIYVDITGNIVCAKTYDLQDNVAKEPNQEFFKEVLSHQNWGLDETGCYFKGLIEIGESFFIVSSRPILTSQAQGPILGAVIMGRQLSSDFVLDLENQTHLSIQIEHLSLPLMSSDFVEADKNLVGSDSYFVKPINSTEVSGFAKLPDVNGNEIAIVKVTVPRSIYIQGLSTVNTFIILTIILFGVMGFVMIINLEWSVISRLLKLTDSVGKITEAGNLQQRGILSDRKLVGRNDELSSLSKSINGMLDRIQDVTEKLQKSQKLAAIGELSVMVAHDLRNPLQGIKIAADCLTNEKISDPAKKARLIDLIGKDVLYCEKIVNDLLGFSGNIRIIPVKTDVKTLISSSLSHLQIPDTIKINDSSQSEPEIIIDAEKMVRVFDNLIKNACDAMPNGGNLTIKSELLKDQLQVSFSDTGCGIDKEHIDKLFTPFFTTKAKGMGFGLAICQKIVEAHNGKISVESTPNLGTTFLISLPIFSRFGLGEIRV